MKNYGAIIALAVVVVLTIVVVTTGDAPDTKVSAPYSIEAVENLTRIELVEAGEDGQLVVLEHTGDEWHITKPVETALNEQVAQQLSAAVTKKINTDDLQLSTDNLADFGLADDAATKVSFFGGSAEAPAVEFYLGSAMTVAGTNAKRTYIKTTDGKVYRAQTDLGSILGKPVDELRSRTVLRLDRNAVSKVEFEYADGTKFTLAKSGDTWSSSQLDFELEPAATSGLLGAISNLNGAGFVDDQTAAQAGLDPAHLLVRASNAQEALGTVLLSEARDGKVFAKAGNKSQIFELAQTVAERIALTPLTLRVRTPKTLPETDIARVAFAGSDRVTLTQDGGAWKFARGGRGEVKQAAVATHVSALASLRALRYEEPDPAVAGLARGERVVITMKDGATHTLVLGADADEHGNVWAQWTDSDLVMVLPSWIRERVAPTAASLTDEAS